MLHAIFVFPPTPMFTLRFLKTSLLRKFTTKKNSSNALMESVNLAGLGEEYHQVIHKDNNILLSLCLFSLWRR